MPKTCILFLVSASFGLAQGYDQKVKASVCSPLVTLYTLFNNEHSELSFEAMKEEVAAILAPTGLQLEWRPLTVTPQESSADEVVVVSFIGKCRMNDLSLRHAEPGSLGWTNLADGHTRPFSVVDCERIRKLINPLLAGVKRGDREALLGRALGRVLAHELYHVFSDSRRHASRGLCKASFTARDLLLDHPRLDEKDVDTLRKGKLSRLFRPKTALAQALPSRCDIRP